MHHKPPGEPVFFPQLHHNNAVTQHCPAAEQLRRDDVSRTRLQIKIFLTIIKFRKPKKGIVIFLLKCVV